jgi:methyl-accepting chemotaxis protein
MKNLSITNRIVFTLAIVLFLGIGGMLAVLLFTEENSKYNKTKDAVDELSQALIHSITFSMGEGSTNVAPMVERIKKIENIKELKVLASDKIRENSNSKMNKDEKFVLDSLKSIFRNEKYNNEEVFLSIEPILAEKNCTSCHDTKEGETLAIVSLKYSMKKTYEEIHAQRLSATVMSIVVILIVFFVVLYFIKKQIIYDLLKSILSIKRLSTGDVTESITTNRTDEIGTLLLSVKTLQVALKDQANSADQIASGNLNIDISILSEQDVLGKAMQTVKENLLELVHDTESLCQSSINGDLKSRADESKHFGEYRNIIQGINSTLDAVINPLNAAALMIQQISKGDIPNKITINYNGDFNTIKNNLNQCIDSINLLVSDSMMLVKSADEGKLDIRANTDKHNGDFKRIISGVNQTLDNVIGPLNVAA